MSTGNLNRTDLYQIHNVVQNTLIASPKDIIISILRNYFAEDSYYHYVSDEWGYPKVKDHTNLSPDAGMNDDIVTRLFIGEEFRHGVIFYPSVIVKSGGARSVPISMSRNKECVVYKRTIISDGYGNSKIFNTPSHIGLAGAWEGSINIEIKARDSVTRDNLVELIKICMVDIRHDELLRAGILVKNVSSSTPSSEKDSGGNDILHRQTVMLDIRSEWHRNIPISSAIDIINICVDFSDNLKLNPVPTAPNIRVTTSVNLSDIFNQL